MDTIKDYLDAIKDIDSEMMQEYILDGKFTKWAIQTYLTNLTILLDEVKEDIEDGFLGRDALENVKNKIETNIEFFKEKL